MKYLEPLVPKFKKKLNAMISLQKRNDVPAVLLRTSETFSQGRLFFLFYFHAFSPRRAMSVVVALHMVQ